MPKKSVASSRPERLVRKSVEDIKRFGKTADAKAMTKRLKERGPDPTAADLQDIPEITDEQFQTLYRPLKKSVTVRIDADVLAWLKEKPGAYQSNMNAVLRAAMTAAKRRV